MLKHISVDLFIIALNNEKLFAHKRLISHTA